MATDDDYDPTKPEYTTPATPDEVEHAHLELLEQQIAKLEMLLSRWQPDAHAPHVFHHYQRILAEMRHEASHGHGGTRPRMRSDPVSQVTHDDAPNVPDFTHEKNCTAPARARSGCVPLVHPIQNANPIPQISPCPRPRANCSGEVRSTTHSNKVRSPETRTQCVSPRFVSVAPDLSAPESFGDSKEILLGPAFNVSLTVPVRVQLTHRLPSHRAATPILKRNYHTGSSAQGTCVAALTQHVQAPCVVQKLQSHLAPAQAPMSQMARCRLAQLRTARRQSCCLPHHRASNSYCRKMHSGC